LHGYDFSCKGLLGIWEGFPPLPKLPSDATSPTQSDRFLEPDAALSRRERRKSRRSHSPAEINRNEFQAALVELAQRRDPDSQSWKPSIPTSKLEARRACLLLAEWSLRSEDLTFKIERCAPVQL
jgi:hypothetical protein